MSVLIPNIKIPDHCWEFPLMSHLLCGYSKEIIPGTKKRDDCPLVEVLPHGRLIDADQLKEYWMPDHDRYFNADYFIHTIDAAKTVIAGDNRE